MVKNAFYFILKALIALEIFKILSFGKQFDRKLGLILKFMTPQAG